MVKELFLKFLNVKIKLATVIGSIVLLFAFNAEASSLYSFNPNNSKIDGSIKYSVIGRYHATFEDFIGDIEYDEKSEKITSVNLTIKAKTIKSNFETLDKIVRSKKILDVENYPDIAFRSQTITQGEGGFLAKGLLTMHGVTKEMTFLFQSQRVNDNGKNVINAEGKWVIPRKEFDVIWNKVLDRGGIVVGNHIGVDWKLSASPKGKAQ